jgi:hypothetical protein
MACRLVVVSMLGLGCDDDYSPQSPSARFDTTFLDFDNVQAGTSAERSFTLTNVGGGNLSGTFAAGLCDPPSTPAGTPCWSLAGDGSYTLGANESKTFTVRFAPYSVSAGGDDCGIGDSHCQFDSPHGTIHCTATGLP